MTKLTKAHLESLVQSKTFSRPAGTLTVCIITLAGGAQVLGESNVINPANFDPKIGEQMAYEDAIEKLWQLEGYSIKRQSATIVVRAAKVAYEAERAFIVVQGKEPPPPWAELTPHAAQTYIEEARRAVAGETQLGTGPVFRAAALASLT